MPCALLLFSLTAHRGFSLLGFTKWNGGICRGIIFIEVRYGKKGFYEGIKHTHAHTLPLRIVTSVCKFLWMALNILKEMV